MVKLMIMGVTVLYVISWALGRVVDKKFENDFTHRPRTELSDDIYCTYKPDEVELAGMREKFGYDRCEGGTGMKRHEAK